MGRGREGDAVGRPVVLRHVPESEPDVRQARRGRPVRLHEPKRAEGARRGRHDGAGDPGRVQEVPPHRADPERHGVRGAAGDDEGHVRRVRAPRAQELRRGHARRMADPARAGGDGVPSPVRLRAGRGQHGEDRVRAPGRRGARLQPAQAGAAELQLPHLFHRGGESDARRGRHAGQAAFRPVRHAVAEELSGRPAEELLAQAPERRRGIRQRGNHGGRRGTRHEIPFQDQAFAQRLRAFQADGVLGPVEGLRERMAVRRHLHSAGRVDDNAQMPARAQAFRAKAESQAGQAPEGAAEKERGRPGAAGVRVRGGRRWAAVGLLRARHKRHGIGSSRADAALQGQGRLRKQLRRVQEPVGVGRIRHAQAQADARVRAPHRDRRELVERVLQACGRREAHGACHVKTHAPRHRRKNRHKRAQAVHAPDFDACRVGRNPARAGAHRRLPRTNFRNCAAVGL